MLHSLERVHVEFFPLHPAAKCRLQPSDLLADGFWRRLIGEKAVALVALHFYRAQCVDRAVAKLGDKALHLATRFARSRRVLGGVPIQVPLKVSAHLWQPRKNANAVRQLSFFRCSYFFSLMSAEAAEGEPVPIASLSPVEVCAIAAPAE